MSLLLALGAAVAVSEADYPVDALRRGEEGVVTVEFQVDAQGFPQMCKVVKSSGYPSLDRGGCRVIVNKAVLLPPVGAALPYTMTKRIRWQIARQPKKTEPDEGAAFGWALLMSGALFFLLTRRQFDRVGSGVAVVARTSSRYESAALIVLLAGTLGMIAVLLFG